MLGRAAILPITCVLALLAFEAAAENRNDLAPYRFRAPAEDLGAVERQRAIIYRNQLQRQQRMLQHDDAFGRLDPIERRRLLETQTELDRMNEIVRSPAPAPLRLPTTRSLPSIPQSVVPKHAP